MVGISVPFAGRGVIGLPGSPFGEHRPNDYHLELAGEGRVWYQDYFSAQDGIIAEIEEDVRAWLLGLTYTVSGEGMIAATKAAVDAGVDLASMDPIDVIRAGPLCMAEGARLKDAFVYPETMPAWFTDADVDFYAGEFERSGFGGPLSFYHNIDNDWHDLADQAGKPLTPPAAVHRRTVRRRHHLGSRGPRPRARGHAELPRHPHGRRRRALDPARSAQGDQPAVARFPWRVAIVGCAVDMVKAAPDDLDGAELRRAFGCFPSGVIAVCAPERRRTGRDGSELVRVRFGGPAPGFDLCPKLLDDVAEVAGPSAARSQHSR